MTHTRLTHSDAYYIAQLLTKLENLEKQLSSKLSADAELTQRTRHLLKDLHVLLAQKEELAQELLEFSFMPKVNRLLLEARQQLKLKKHIQKVVKPARPAGTALEVRGGFSDNTRRNHTAIPLYPQPGPYKPIPMPLRDEERCALIEDALTKLKMLLSES